MKKNWRDFSGVKVGDELVFEDTKRNDVVKVVVDEIDPIDFFVEGKRRFHYINRKTGKSNTYDDVTVYFPNDPDCPKLTEEE